MVLRQTPFDLCHRQAGARMVEFGGYELPLYYKSELAEVAAVRTAAGLFDVSHMGEFRVDGPLALSFLQRLTSNDVQRLVPGRAQYSALLSPSGTLLDDLLVYRLAEESFWLVVNASRRQADWDWLVSQAHDGVNLRDESDATALLALQGPRAVDILAPLSQTAVGELKRYSFAASEIGGLEVLLSRTGYTGEDGFEIYCQAAGVDRLWGLILDAGSDVGLLPCGLAARDVLRLEAGLLLYGQDMDERSTPLEVGLGWTVRFDKGDFLGRERLLEQKENGVEETLVGLQLLERGIARSGHRVLADGEECGVVTSGTFSPSLDKAVALARIAVGAKESQLAVAVRKRQLLARVVPLPFYKAESS